MKPRKLNVLACFPAYGGNGATSQEVPDIRRWYARTMLTCSKDSRIDEFHEITLSDTPITMVRNKFVLEGRRLGADVLVMVDSDQNPLLHEPEDGIKPFWESSFDFLYDHYEKGPCVIGAPYCGPPGYKGCENMYVFEWQNAGDHGDESIMSLEQISRIDASHRRGIQPCAALPTGMIMYDIRAFELIEPSKNSPLDVLEELVTGKITKSEALRQLHKGFFYYEWKDNYAAEKSSTEDVTNTRDISLAGIAKYGYNPVYCNWDSPVGHWKPWCVRGRPQTYRAEEVAATFQNIVLSKSYTDEMTVDAAQFLASKNKVTP